MALVVGEQPRGRDLDRALVAADRHVARVEGEDVVERLHGAALAAAVALAVAALIDGLRGRGLLRRGLLRRRLRGRGLRGPVAVDDLGGRGVRVGVLRALLDVDLVEGGLARPAGHEDRVLARSVHREGRGALLVVDVVGRAPEPLLGRAAEEQLLPARGPLVRVARRDPEVVVAVMRLARRGLRRAHRDVVGARDVLGVPVDSERVLERTRGRLAGASLREVVFVGVPHQVARALVALHPLLEIPGLVARRVVQDEVAVLGLHDHEAVLHLVDARLAAVESALSGTLGGFDHGDLHDGCGLLGGGLLRLRGAAAPAADLGDGHGPFTAAVVGQGADGDLRAARDGLDGALALGARQGVVPGHVVGAALAREVERRSAALRQVDRVGVARVGQHLVGALGARGQAVGVAHPLERQVLEELAGGLGPLVHALAGGEVLHGEVAALAARGLVAEVPFGARAALHVELPQHVAELVVVRLPARIALGVDALRTRARLVEERDRRTPGLLEAAEEAVEVRHGRRGRGLEGQHVERVGALERLVSVVLRGVGVQRHGMVVGVDRLDGVGLGAQLARAVGGLLPHVPDDAVVVGEARDHLADEQLALQPDIPVVEEVVVLRLLEEEVQDDALLLHVVEDDLPLVELGDVEGARIDREVERALAVAGVRADAAEVGGGPGPDVAPVAAHGVEQHVGGVHPVLGEVVDRADDALALAAVPGRVAAVEVLDVRLVVVAVDGVVEARVGQEVLGAAHAGLQEHLVGAREVEVLVAVVLQHPLAAQVVAALVRGADRERARGAVHRAGRGAGLGAVGHRDLVALAERCLPGPGPLLRRVEMRAPHGTRGGAAVGRVTVGREVAGDPDGLARALVAEGDVEPVVQEGIGFLLRLRPVEVERDLVPLLRLASDLRRPRVRHMSVSYRFWSLPAQAAATAWRASWPCLRSIGGRSRESAVKKPLKDWHSNSPKLTRRKNAVAFRRTAERLR